MHRPSLVAGLAAAVLPAMALAGAQPSPPFELTPPAYFALQLEANAWTTNTTWMGWSIYYKQVSNTQFAAVIAPPAIPDVFFQAVAPNKTEDGTYYSLLIDLESGYDAYLQPDLLQAFWEPLYFTVNNDTNTAGPPTVEQNLFYINGTEDAMYLQMKTELAFGDYIGFQGWMGCYWSQLVPQLFIWDFYGTAESNELPEGCTFFNLRVVPLE